MRLLHVSDVHLGSDAVPCAHLAEFASFVRQARTIAPDVVLITGDFFENNRVQAALVEEVMRLLARLPRVVMLPGNHDAYDERSVYRRFDFERACPNVRLIRSPAGEAVRFPELPATFWGRALVTHSPAFRPLAAVPARFETEWSVALAHGHYLDADTPTLDGSPIYAGDLAAVDWDYVALGHWPRHTVIRETPPACYAGELVKRGSPPSLGCVLATLTPGAGSFRYLRLPCEGV